MDYNSQAYFRMLHIIGSSRNSIRPNGTAVKPPQEKRPLPSKEAFNRIHVPTYDQVWIDVYVKARAHSNAWRASSCAFLGMTKYLNCFQHKLLVSVRPFLFLFVYACLNTEAAYLLAYTYAHTCISVCIYTCIHPYVRTRACLHFRPQSHQGQPRLWKRFDVAVCVSGL